MRTVIVMCVLIALAFCAPMINDNFTSNDIVKRTIKNSTHSFSETTYEWYSGRMRRIDTTINSSKIVVYQFDTNHTEYVDVDATHCIRRDFREPWVPFFDWVRYSKASGSCAVDGKSGSKWVDDRRREFVLTLCAAGDVPLAVMVDDSDRGVSDTVTFSTFTSGNPAVSNFNLPARCLIR